MHTILICLFSLKIINIFGFIVGIVPFLLNSEFYCVAEGISIFEKKVVARQFICFKNKYLRFCL